MKLVVIALLLVNVGYMLIELSSARSELAFSPDGNAERLPGKLATDSGHDGRKDLPMLGEVDIDSLADPKGARKVGRLASADGELASPLGVSDVLSQAKAMDTADVTTRGYSVPQTCFAVGPITDGGLLAQVQIWLSGEDFSTALRQHERQEVALYWVHFPPFDTRKEAVARVKALDAAGISDIGLIDRGDMARAVSLGVYRQRSSLDRRLAELRSRGYEPTVTQRYRTIKASWLDVRAQVHKTFEQKRFRARFGSLDVVPTPCTNSEIGTDSEIAASHTIPYNSAQSGTDSSDASGELAKRERSKP